MNYDVVGGGGSKAYSYIGALKKVNLSKVKAVSGSSAGSLIGFFICLTKSSQKIEEIATDERYFIFDENDIDIHNFLPFYGFNKGDNIERKLEILSEEYCGFKRPTFSELKAKTDVDFFVTSTNISLGECEIFSSKETPDFDVIKALRMSISIPLYFTPVIHNEHTYVDGSFFINTPSNCILENFDDVSVENSIIIQSEDRALNNCNGLFDYFLSIFHMVRRKLNNKMDTSKFKKVSIDTKNFSLIDHKCDKVSIKNMIEHGFNSFI